MRARQELLPEILLIIFPYAPPDDYGAVSRVSSKWRQISVVMFRQYLAWRQGSTPYQMQDGPPPLKTTYHLYGHDCYTLTREYMPLSGDARISLTHHSLQQVESNGAQALAEVSPKAKSTQVSSNLLTIHKVVFCHMYKALLLVLSTDVIEIHSLVTGEFQTRLLPIPSQRTKGMKFTNIVSCYTDPEGVTTVACKMRPGSSGGDSDVNLYKILASGKLYNCTRWKCCLKKVRTCKLTGRHIVMKGISTEEKSQVVALDVATGAKIVADASAEREDGGALIKKEAMLIGVDSASVALFLHQPSVVVTLPNAWCRWSDRLMRKKHEKNHEKSFEIIQWNVQNNKVTTADLAVCGIPAPYGWPTNEAFSLIIDKDRCHLTDHDSVLVCFFQRVSVQTSPTTSPSDAPITPTPRPSAKGVGVVCVYTKGGMLLSTLDPSVPSIRKMAFPSGEADDMSNDVSTEFLASHCKNQVLLFSVTVGTGDSVRTKILANEFHPRPAILPPGIV